MVKYILALYAELVFVKITIYIIYMTMILRKRRHHAPDEKQQIRIQ